MKLFIAYTLFALALLILVDCAAYLFLGTSLAYCPPVDSCGDWFIGRLASVAVLAAVGLATLNT